MEINFRPIVYMRDRTHTYLWLRDLGGCGQFLTMESGVIERVSLTLSGGVYHVTHNDARWELTPHPYDPIQAFKKYRDSFLERSEAAATELSVVLSLEPGPKPVRNQVEKPVAISTKPEKKARNSPIGGGYTLAQMCQELGIDPSDARKMLRNKKIEKPQGKWEWTNPEAAESVRKALIK